MCTPPSEWASTNRRRRVLTTLPPAPLVPGWRGGRPPEWRPRFSGKQIREARKAALKLTGGHALVQRARLGLLLYRRPAMTSPDAARRLGQSPSWVYKWGRRWALEGVSFEGHPRPGRPRRGFSWEDPPRPGRPRRFSPPRPRPGDRGGLRAAQPASVALQPPLGEQHS